MPNVIYKKKKENTSNLKINSWTVTINYFYIYCVFYIIHISLNIKSHFHHKKTLRFQGKNLKKKKMKNIILKGNF